MSNNIFKKNGGGMKVLSYFFMSIVVSSLIMIYSPGLYASSDTSSGDDQKATTIVTEQATPEQKGKGEKVPAEDYYLEEYEEAEVKIADPIWPWNKGMYHFNDRFYFWVLKPVTRGYSAVVPKDMRIAVSNFFYNIATPIRFVNNLLQLKMKNAGNELVSLVVNSTLGVGGLGNVAKDKLNIQSHKEDFGQTLGWYGLGHGFYIVWPLIGPSSMRDTVGLAGDWLLNPLTYLTPSELTTAESTGIVSVETVNKTSFRIGDYEAFKESAVDPYTGLRDAYIQYRNKAVEE